MASLRTSFLRGAAAIAMTAAGLALCSTPAAADAAVTYKAKCAMCHGADGKGDTAAGKKMGARDFASPEVQKADDAELISITTKGKNKMPSYEKSLKPDEVKELIIYIRQLAKGK